MSGVLPNLAGLLAYSLETGDEAVEQHVRLMRIAPVLAQALIDAGDALRQIDQHRADAILHYPASVDLSGTAHALERIREVTSAALARLADIDKELAGGNP